MVEKESNLPFGFTNLARFVFIVVCLGLFGLNLGQKLVLVFSYAPDIGGFERNVIWGIQQVMLGKPLYTSPDQGAYALVQYNPLYYYLLGGLGKGFSIDPFEAHSVYRLARGFNLVCSLFSCFLIFWMARKSFKVSGFLSVPLAVLAFLWMEQFSISGRPDSLKALLFQLVLFFLLQIENRKRLLMIVLAVVSSFLAFCTKQDGLVFCGILPLVLLVQKEWKHLGLVVISYAVLLFGFVFGMQAITDSNFLKNVAGGLQNGISLSWFVGAFGNFFSVMALFFGLALVVSVQSIFEKDGRFHVLAAGFFCSFFPQLLFSLKFGSGPNYFMECILVSLLIAVAFLSRFSGSLQTFGFQPFAPYLLGSTVLALLFLTQSFRWFTGVFLNQEADLKQKYANQKEVVSWLHNDRPEGKYKVLVLINMQYEDHLTTLLPNHVVSPMRDVAAQVFNAKGKSGFRNLQTAIETGKIDYIVSDLKTIPPFLEFNYSGFKQVSQEIGGYTVFSFTPEK